MDFSGATKFTPKATELFKKGVIYSGIEGMTIQKGIDDTKDLRYLETTSQLRAFACGSAYRNNGVTTEKKISVYQLEDKTKYCQKDWQGYATPNDFMNQIILSENEATAVELMQLTWTGSISGGDVMDGLYTHINKKASITSEAVTIVALDTAYALAHSRAIPNSVVVKDVTDATTYTEGTDYTIAYEDGTVTAITGGAISASDVIHVTYDYAVGATSLGTATTITASNVDNFVEDLITARAGNKSMKKRGVAEIYVSPAVYQLYRSNRLAANLYWDNVNTDMAEGTSWVFGYKGSVKIVEVPELEDIDDMFITWRANWVIGMDEVTAEGKSYKKVFYNEDEDLLKTKYFTKRGTQVKFLEEVYKLR